MRPMTPHYVVTTGPSMVFGKHYFCASTLAESCYGVVHSLLEESVLTNTTHAQVISYISCFLCWWERNLKDRSEDGSYDGTPIYISQSALTNFSYAESVGSSSDDNAVGDDGLQEANGPSISPSTFLTN